MINHNCQDIHKFISWVAQFPQFPQPSPAPRAIFSINCDSVTVSVSLKPSSIRKVWATASWRQARCGDFDWGDCWFTKKGRLMMVSDGWWWWWWWNIALMMVSLINFQMVHWFEDVFVDGTPTTLGYFDHSSKSCYYSIQNSVSIFPVTACEQCEINPSIIPFNPGWFRTGFPVLGLWNNPQYMKGSIIPELIINQPSCISYIH